MAYAINKYDGTLLTILEDGTLNTSTSVGLLGRNYVGYGEIQNENFLFLLENFANTSPPSTPLEGQTWFNKETKALNVYTGTTWVPVNSAIMAPTEPVATSGALWYNTSTGQLFLYDVDVWKSVGSEILPGYGSSKWVSTLILDTSNNLRPVVQGVVDDVIIAILSKDSFIINTSVIIPGFSEIISGLNFSINHKIAGNLTGNASTASRLETPRRINGVAFTGATDITITSTTTGSLISGDYILGNDYNGSVNTTWSVDASSSNLIGKIVVRDSSGDFSAGTITANKFVGPLEGNVSTSTGISSFNVVEANEFRGIGFSGNAFSASKLAPGARINGVLFTGTSDINVPVPASNITGNRLAANVVDSELTSLGFLSSLRVQNTGIFVGNSLEFNITVDDTMSPVMKVNNGKTLKIQVADSKQGNGFADFDFMPSDVALAAGGTENPAFVGDVASKSNLGLPTRTFGNVYSDNFVGIASSARYADLAENYTSDLDYEPGTVLAFGGEFEVTLADESTQQVAGVVSTNPAYLMNAECVGNHVVSIALQGRVPCKIRGSVKKGDILVSAGDGFAKSCSNPLIGTVIGKSLQNFDGYEGIIEIAVGRL